MAQPPMKYQPYHGYGTTQCFAFVWPPTRIRTRSDWRQPHEPPTAWRYTDLGMPYEPWKRYRKRSGGSGFLKREMHRRFRRISKHAIAESLADDALAVSHAFRLSGDYLD